MGGCNMQKIVEVIFCMLVIGLSVLPISAIHFSEETTMENTVVPLNNPPDKPTLEGPQQGKYNVPYKYTACATDPDGDKIFYTFDWGDDCISTMTCCFASGECCTTCHCWEKAGRYQVKVCAVDVHHCYGEWSDYLSVAMPKSSSPNDADISACEAIAKTDGRLSII